MMRPEDGATFQGGVEKSGNLYNAWCYPELRSGGRFVSESKEWAFDFQSEQEAIAWIDRQCAGRGFDRWQDETKRPL
jgi:hypothetical protein